MEYPEEYLYLRLYHLLRELEKCLGRNNGEMFNVDAFLYLRTILRQLTPEIEYCKKTENHILSPRFLNQKGFKDSDRQEMLPIIRNYKLKKLI